MWQNSNQKRESVSQFFILPFFLLLERLLPCNTHWYTTKAFSFGSKGIKSFLRYDWPDFFFSLCSLERFSERHMRHMDPIRLPKRYNLWHGDCERETECDEDISSFIDARVTSSTDFVYLSLLSPLSICVYFVGNSIWWPALTSVHDWKCQGKCLFLSCNLTTARASMFDSESKEWITAGMTPLTLLEIGLCHVARLLLSSVIYTA
jgi:hypothetical protein